MIHSLSRRKSLELNFRGIQFKKFCFLFFSLKGPVSAFICLFFTLISLIRFTGERGEGLLRQRMFSGLFFLLFISPLHLGSDCRTGVTDWRNPEKSGKRWNTETCCSSKKKNIDGLELSQYFQITRGVGRIERQLLPRHLLQQRRLLEI